MNAVRIALALCAMLFAAACLPVASKTPLGTTAGAASDPALIGSWKALDRKDEDGPGYIHLIAGKDGALTALVVSTGSTGHEGDWSVFAVTVARLGNRHYLNARSVIDNGKPASADEAANTIPISYTISGDGTLSLALIDEDAAKAAIAAGKIEGTVAPGQLGDVTLTASADKLDAFFASDEGARLFTQKLVVLKKID